MKNYEYEADLDILYVNNNPSMEKVIGNLVFGNIVVDIGENGRVLGAEIDCASKLFNFPAEQLSQLEVAKIQVMKMGNMLTLEIVIATASKEHSFQFAVTQELSSQNKLPIAVC